jgi:hypothetical protein
MVDPVDHRFTAADVVGNIFNVGSTTNTSGQVQAGNIKAYAMPFLKEISGG